jgi:hypothetical protein
MAQHLQAPALWLVKQSASTLLASPPTAAALATKPTDKFKYSYLVPILTQHRNYILE